MRPCTSPVRISRSTPSIALTPPKLSEMPFSVSRPGRRVLAHHLRQQLGTRTYLAMLLERSAVLVVEHLGDAAGHDKHDHEQKHRIEEGGPRHQRRRELGQGGQDDGAEQRSEDRAAPADQDGDEEQHRQVEREGVGRDVGLQRREQAARDAGDGAAEQEHRDQQGRLGDADQLGRHLRVADGHERPPEPAARPRSSSSTCRPSRCRGRSSRTPTGCRRARGTPDRARRRHRRSRSSRPGPPA